MGDYIHHTPGRLRVKIAAVRGNPALGNRIKQLLADTWGIAGVCVRPTTGSIIIRYDSQILDANRILNFLAEHGHIEITNLSASPRTLRTAFHRLSEVIIKEALSLAAIKVFHGSYASILTKFL